MAVNSMILLLFLAFTSAIAADGNSGSGSPNPSPAPPGSPSGGQPSQEDIMEAMNLGNSELAKTSLLILVAIVAALLLYRILISSIQGVRRISTMESQKQSYWAQPTKWYAYIKKTIVYAPLFRTRHHSEMTLMKGWTVGYLPTRFQSIFITILIVSNIIYSCIGIEWDVAGTSDMLFHLRNRTGTIAVSNMIPMILLAGRNNPLLFLLNIPYDSFNMMHRWLGRIIVVEALAHTVCFTARVVAKGGWSAVAHSFILFGDAPQTGLIAVCGFIAIIVTSVAVLRHLAYDVWHHIHVFLAVMVTVGLYYHLQDSPTQILLKVFIAGWIVEHVIRIVRLVYRNFGSGGTLVLVEQLPGNAVKVTISMARPWTFQPGQHVYIAIPSIGLWTTHPFSLAWSDPSTPHLNTSDPEKGPSHSPTESTSHTLSSPSTLSHAPSNTKPTMTAIIRRRKGFTARLSNALLKMQDGRFTARAFIEGPYGNAPTLSSYGTILLFAGGVGITHQVSYLRSLLEGHATSTIACRRLLLVWAVTSPEHLEWIRPWMTQILAMEGRRQVLRVQVYVTRAADVRGLSVVSSSGDDTVRVLQGRPDVDAIVGGEFEVQVGAMAVGVCGPGGMADDVRRAVRVRQGVRSVDFVEEAFGW